MAEQNPVAIGNQAYAEMAVLGTLKTVEELQMLQATNPSWILYGDAYALVVQYQQSYGELPPPEVLAARDEDWNPPEGDFRHWLGEYQRLRMINDAKKVLRNAVQELEDDPQGAVNRIITDLQGIGYYNANEAHSLDATIEQRYNRYLERLEAVQSGSLQMWGIPTGIQVIDATRQGWLPGELIGFFARPTVGKTWMLLRSAVIAWLCGRRVLCVSPEMPAEEIGSRVDALIAGQMGIPISQEGIATGNPAVKDAYADLVQRVKETERFHMIDASVKLSDLRSQIQYLDPDITLVDGIFLLQEDRKRNNSWEKMSDLAYGLKDIATQHQSVIMCSHQSSRIGSSRKASEATQGRGDNWVMPSLNDAAYGDAFVQAMSTVFTMMPDRDTEAIRWYSIRKVRHRRIEFVPRRALGWDVDRGLIVDLGQHQANITAIKEDLKLYGIKT